MNYVELNGTDKKEDIKKIKEIVKEDLSYVFVYSGAQKLHEYIDDLYANGKGLDDTELYSFKVCYENISLDLTLQKNEKIIKIKSMSKLIEELDNKSDSRIIVENDDQNQLSFIVQQLIFIEYPLEKVDILLEKEERDAEKTKRFMENIHILYKECNRSIEKLQKLKLLIEDKDDDSTKEERIEEIKKSLEICMEIKKNIKKSVEMKIAVAASKKAGKSVIINCFLGKEIAPTSVELATPNNCYYSKSNDNYYYLRTEMKKIDKFGKKRYYLPKEGTDEDKCYKTTSLEEIHNEIGKRFKKAQKDAKGGFSLPDMYIKYVSDDNIFSSYTIIDTAGPDAAVSIRDSNGNEEENQHYKSAMCALKKCDVAVFVIDYSKYLTTSEEDYLGEVKKIFTDNNKFNSLIFALNKIDARYMDANSVKSCIKSVDFIKTRMTAIDEKYKDCIIFPTSSLEYFYAIEAENAGVTELDAKNNLPIEKMRDVTFAHKDSKSLPWLYSQSGYLRFYHGIKTISYDVFKKDSRMPDLMNYVSYVVQGKARDEKVRNLTRQIAEDEKKLQGVLKSVERFETAIKAEDEKLSDHASVAKIYRSLGSDITDFGRQSFQFYSGKSETAEPETEKEKKTEMLLLSDHEQDVPAGRKYIRGERTDISECSEITVIFEYDNAKAETETDVYTFMLNAEGKAERDEDLVFFGNRVSVDGSVKDLSDKCRHAVSFTPSELSDRIHHVVVTFSVYGSEEKNFRKTVNPRVVIRASEPDISGYHLLDLTNEKTVEALEFYRHNGRIKMKITSSGYFKGIQYLCDEYGIETE